MHAGTSAPASAAWGLGLSIPDTEPCCNLIQTLVPSPQQRAWCEERGGQQMRIHQTESNAMQALGLDKYNYLIVRGDFCCRHSC